MDPYILGTFLLCMFGWWTLRTSRQIERRLDTLEIGSNAAAPSWSMAGYRALSPLGRVVLVFATIGLSVALVALYSYPIVRGAMSYLAATVWLGFLVIGAIFCLRPLARIRDRLRERGKPMVTQPDHATMTKDRKLLALLFAMIGGACGALALGAWAAGIFTDFWDATVAIAVSTGFGMASIGLAWLFRFERGRQTT